MQEESDTPLFKQLFPDSEQQQSLSVPYYIQDYEINMKQVYSYVMSYNFEYIMLGHYNGYTLIDLISRSYYTHATPMQQSYINTAVAIGYYNHYVAMGNQIGTFTIQQFTNSTNQLQPGKLYTMFEWSPNTIQSIYSTSNNLIITVSLSQIRWIQYERLLDIQVQLLGDTFPMNIIVQTAGIAQSVYCSESNQLIIATGDYQIIVYSLTNDITTMLSKYNTYLLHPFDIINKLTISNDGRLLAIGHCKLFNSDSYRIDIMDLKRKGKIIKSYVEQEPTYIDTMQFFPIQNMMLVALHNHTTYVLDFQSVNHKQYVRQESETIKFTSPLSYTQNYPNFLLIAEQGQLHLTTFEAPKISNLYYIPFMYFVEIKLSQLMDYKPLIQQYFQSTYYNGFLGVDKRNMNMQMQVINGEQLFEPLFETVRRMSQFKLYYQKLYEDRIKFRRRKFELPQWIAQWALKQAYLNTVNPQQNNDYNTSKAVKQPKQVKKQRNKVNIKMRLGEGQNQDEEMQLLGVNTEIQVIKQHNLNVSDDRYLIVYRLITNLHYENTTMLILSNCSLLFDNRMPFKHELVFNMINRMDRVNYLDLSNNQLYLEDVKEIRILNQLKYLDLSYNQLGNIKKRPLIKRRTNKNSDNQTELIENDLQFYEHLFTKIPIINLRNNNFSDEEGSDLIGLIRACSVRVIDISGNFEFDNYTLLQVSDLIESYDHAGSDSQLIIIEFNEQLNEQAMKQITQLLIQQSMKLIPQNNQRMSTSQQYAHNYVYVVRSNTNYQWDSSLLNLYEQKFEYKNDEVLNCCYALMMVFYHLIISCYDNIRNNSIGCLKQIFCGVYCLQKYCLCCYCVFLQSRYGSWITRLLGIKTADYEYNNKKDDLKKYLEQRSLQLNVLFTLNFFIFYIVVIAAPIYFVLQCQGHQWTGHFIYAGYSLLVGILEMYLANNIMQFNISHEEFSTGPIWRRVLFFVKDMTLSQVAKFDVYSDMCFITTVMTCGDNLFIGYIAILIMALSLGTTAYHVLKLLCSRMGGDENYIDYLCNYCSFVEINVPSSLLEKWTIQNTSNFLCFIGLPNRIYSATFRTFAEDIPQFILQVVYLLINPNKTSIEILMLSLATSTMSTIISITKSITITKANRINDHIMMNEVKTKLGLTTEISDPKLNEQLITFLHDYYDNFDGKEETQTLQYGLNDAKLNKYVRANHMELRQISGPTYRTGVIKGVTSLEEQSKPVDISGGGVMEVDEMFESYIYLIHSQQAKVLQTMWSSKSIEYPSTVTVLLEQEIQDYIESVDMTHQHQTFPFIEGSFIESLSVQAAILDTFTDKIRYAKNRLKILDLGCGKGFTAQAILKLCEKLNPTVECTLLAVDHIPDLIEQCKQSFALSNYHDDRIEFRLKDCREDLRELGQFDIIHVGFAVQSERILQPLLKDQGIAFIPIAALPQDHDYMVMKNDNGFHTEMLGVKSQSGALIPKELQYSTHYQYYQIKRGIDCAGCGSKLEQAQYYSPWYAYYLCINCGNQDDLQTVVAEFKHVTNLVFIPASATDVDMKTLDSWKFGRNLFPKRNQKGNKQHIFDCNPCQRNMGDELDCTEAVRYICLNCIPGKFEGQIQHICYDCVQCYIDEEMQFERTNKSYYLPGHKDSHILLKVHFYFDYIEY